LFEKKFLEFSKKKEAGYQPASFFMVSHDY